MNKKLVAKELLKIAKSIMASYIILPDTAKKDLLKEMKKHMDEKTAQIYMGNIEGELENPNRTGISLYHTLDFVVDKGVELPESAIEVFNKFFGEKAGTQHAYLYAVNILKGTKENGKVPQEIVDRFSENKVRKQAWEKGEKLDH